MIHRHHRGFHKTIFFVSQPRPGTRSNCAEVQDNGGGKKNPQWRQVLWRRQKTRQWAFFSWTQDEKRDFGKTDQSRTWFRYGAVTVHYGLGSRIGECAGLRKRISTPRRQHSRDERCCYFENRTRWRIGGFGGSFQSPAVWPYCTFGSDGECGCPLVWRGENCGKSGTAGLVSKFKAESKPKLRIERLHLLVASSLLSHASRYSVYSVWSWSGCAGEHEKVLERPPVQGMVAKDRSGCNAQKMQRNVRNWNGTIRSRRACC